MSETFMGQIIPWPLPYAPEGWAFCDGKSIQIAQNAALFALIGNNFNSFNSNQYFLLPDLRGKVIIGTGQAPGSTINYTLGLYDGHNQVILTEKGLPSHSHQTSVSSARAVTNTPQGNVPAKADTDLYAPPGTPQASQNTLPVGLPVGYNWPVDIVQPYVALNYIICVYGYFPEPA